MFGVQEIKIYDDRDEPSFTIFLLDVKHQPPGPLNCTGSSRYPIGYFLAIIILLHPSPSHSNTEILSVYR